MRFFATLILVPLIALTNSSQDQSQKPASRSQTPLQSEVELELKSVADFYRAGNFIDAHRHAERAVSLDPSNRTALVFLARVLHQRFQPGDETSENIELARAAISAYQRLLVLDWQNEEAYKAVAVLYEQIHADQLLTDWLQQRAQNLQFSNEKRAEAYAKLAARFWDCSFKITEHPDQKVVDKEVVIYIKPTDALEFEKSKQCAAKGLEIADMALALDNKSDVAWSYKTNLLLEKAKLAEMEGMDPAKAAYLKEAKQAGERTKSLAAEKRRREEEDSSEPKANAQPSPSPRVPPQRQL